jgi:hypothetical protein
MSCWDAWNYRRVGKPFKVEVHLYRTPSLPVLRLKTGFVTQDIFPTLPARLQELTGAADQTW